MDVIAIDGLAGTGKSTLARGLAKRLGISHLDSGATFRMVAWACIKAGADLNDPEGVQKCARSISMSYEGSVCLVDGVDVTAEIRTDEVSSAASKIAVYPKLREYLSEWQRSWVQEHGPSVAEGRDMTSIVFPDAALKIYLEADPILRADRRSESSANSVTERDSRDLNRTLAPTVKVPDAYVIDTSKLTIKEVEDMVMELWHSHSFRGTDST